MNTGGRRPKFRTIREGKSFEECVRKLGDYGHVDELIGHLKWRLARNPISYSFQPSPRLKTRQAFTEELAESVPVLRVFFVIQSNDLISLLWIEDADDAPPLGFDDWLDII